MKKQCQKNGEQFALVLYLYFKNVLFAEYQLTASCFLAMYCLWDNFYMAIKEWCTRWQESNKGSVWMMKWNVLCKFESML